MRAIPKQAVAIVSEFEGCVLVAYPDPATGGDPWTVGYGHTGPEVKPGMKITAARAKALLTEDLKVAAAKLRTVVKPDIIAALDDCQYAALLSFVFNLGAGRTWSIWKVLNAGRFDEVPAQLARFVNAGGKKMKGLVRRRAAEAALWHEGDAEEADLPSSVTRSSPTPPTPTDTKPLTKSKSFNAQGIAALNGSLSVGTATLREQVEPYSHLSDVLGKIMVVLIVLTAISSVVGLYLTWMKKQQANR